MDNPHPKQLYGMTERGMQFMAWQVRAGKPFYLQMSHYASRQGGDASPEALATVRKWGGNLSEREIDEAAADLDLDIAFGMVLKKLDELGIANNTYVIFTTDHGTPGRNPPLAGGKGTVSEGGLRVPFIIRGTVKRPREEFVVHFPHYDHDPEGPASAILLGRYKLIRIYESGSLRLFDLATDLGERNELAQQLASKAAELDRRLTDYLHAVNAQMPTTNPNYDPSKPQPEPKRGGKGPGKGGRKAR